MTTQTIGAMQCDQTDDIRLLALQIVHALVEEPEAIEIKCEETEGLTCFRIRVSAADLGKIIGKQGRTARSIRIILAAISMKTGHRYSLDIVQAE